MFFTRKSKRSKSSDVTATLNFFVAAINYLSANMQKSI